MGWKQVAVLYGKDYSGMSYGPEVVGFAATRGVRIESVMLRGDDTVTARLALAELKSTGVRVILSVMTPLEQFEIFPIAESLGLFGPEYTWLGATAGFGNPKAMVARSRDASQMARVLTGGLYFNHQPKPSYGTRHLAEHVVARGINEVYTLFSDSPHLNSTLETALSSPFSHVAVPHAYDLVWLLALGHAKMHSANHYGTNGSNADDFVKALTADTFLFEGITGLVELDEHRGRRVAEGLADFTVHQITNELTLKLIGTVDSDGNFLLDGNTPSFHWRDGSQYPASVPTDGSSSSSSSSSNKQPLVGIYIVAGVGAVLLLCVVALLLKYRRVVTELQLFQLRDQEKGQPDTFRMQYQTPVTEAVEVLKALGGSYRVPVTMRRRSVAAARNLLESRDLHAPLLGDERFAEADAGARRMQEAARHLADSYTQNGAYDVASTKDLEAYLETATLSPSRSGRTSEEVNDDEVAYLQGVMKQAAVRQSVLLKRVGCDASLNIFQLTAASADQPLVVTAMTVIRNFGLLRSLRLNEYKLLLYLKQVEAGYQAANPYHNNIHAADVLSRLASIIRAEGFFTDGSVASKCYLLTAVIAAAVHDYAHPGLSNDYEVAFDTPVSRRYNEQAVLEHQSVYFALELLRNDERLNFMSHLAQPLQRTIISRIIQLVLATDMKRHFSILGEFKGQASGAAKYTESNAAFDTWPDADKMLALTLAIKGPRDATPARPRAWRAAAMLDCFACHVLTRLPDEVADIGHSFLPWELHKKWSACLEREFFTQGQRYVQAGMEPPRLMDPSQPGVTEPVNQLAFFNVIAMPLLTTWASVFAQSGNELLAHANSNVRHWERKARDAGSSVSVPIDAAKTSDPAAAGDHASHRSNNSFHAHSSRAILARPTGGLMAAVNWRSRVLEGECLVECFEEAYASEPQRYKNNACFGPLLAPVAVVERATWEAQFQLAAWNELGRDSRLSNAAKSFKLCGFPSAVLASWVNDIVK
eukprot:jgi/Tetstr1/454363/TSEL_041270.t1